MQEPATANGEPEDVRLLLDAVLQGERLILASNRGPMEHHVQPNGDLQARRGSGGVVTALSGLTGQAEFTWIASAMGEGDRRVAAANEGRAVRSPLPGQRVSVRYVTTARRVYHKYYNIICNPLLWFLQHYMWSSPYTPRIDGAIYDAWENGYAQVNREFADAIIEEAGGESARPLVMLHDYHLYLAPGDGARGAAPGAHPTLPPHSLALLLLLGTPARRHQERHLRQPLQRRHSRLPVGARRPRLPRFVRHLPRRRGGGLQRKSGALRRAGDDGARLSHLHQRGRGAPRSPPRPAPPSTSSACANASASRPSSASTAPSPARTSSAASPPTRRCSSATPSS